MASKTASMGGRRLLSRLSLSSKQNVRPFVGSFSSKASNLNDPSTFVQGLTTADLDKDPVLAEYFAANFPEYGTASDADSSTSPSESSATVNQTEEQEVETSSPLNIRTLSGYKRSVKGSQPCYRLRERQLLIPGLIYGSDPTQNILSIDPSSRISVMTPWEQIQREMDRFTYHNFESRVYDLTVYEEDDHDEEEGAVHRVVPANVQFHPIQNKIYCCNYLRYHAGKPIEIPIVYANEDESGAMKRGGFVVPQNRHISCLVEDGVPIPEAVEMDCTGLKLNEVIRMDRIIFPPGVKASKRVKPERFLVGTLFGRRADDDGEEAGEDSEEEESA